MGVADELVGRWVGRCSMVMTLAVVRRKSGVFRGSGG